MRSRFLKMGQDPASQRVRLRIRDQRRLRAAAIRSLAMLPAPQHIDQRGQRLGGRQLSGPQLGRGLARCL